MLVFRAGISAYMRTAYIYVLTSIADYLSLTKIHFHPMRSWSTSKYTDRKRINEPQTIRQEGFICGAIVGVGYNAVRW